MTGKAAKRPFPRSAMQGRLVSAHGANTSTTVTPERAHLTDDGVSLRSGGQLADEQAAVSTGPPRRFPAPAETVDAPPDSGRHWADRRGYFLRRLLAGADLLALVCAAAITLATVTLVGRTSKPADVLLFFLLLPLWTYIASLLRLYHLADRFFDSSWVDEIAPIVLAATAWNWIFLLARAAFESGPVEVLPSIAVWSAMIVTIPTFRSAARLFARRCSWYRQPVVIVGVPPDVSRVARRIRRHPEYGLDVVRRMEIDRRRTDREVDVDRRAGGTQGPPIVDSPRMLERVESAMDDREMRFTVHTSAGPEELAEIVTFGGVSRVIVASSVGDLEERSRLVRRLVEHNVHVDLVSGESDSFSNGSSFHYLEGLPVLSIPPARGIRAWAALKRLFDAVAAAVALAALSPLLAWCAIRIKGGSPGPVLFRQMRIGRDGTRFEFLKFRTMVKNADALKIEVEALNIHRKSATPGMFKIPGDPRITRVGHWLRRWSLDELPQLWNVLKGDMSLVGPRPLIPEEAERVSADYAVRLQMRPGITGPWQALGRSEIGFGDMVKLDYTYVTHWSFAQDVRLLLRTIGAVAKGRGAY
jgi:lipopolysaccharide/colanic/teichoic acid biosynthesis glycosyltransferase